jgi:hypothetical protein
MAEDRLDRMDRKLDLVAGDVAVLKTDVMSLRDGQADLARQMRVLHEEVIDRIRTIGEGEFAAIRSEMRAGFADLRQILTDHITVGDAADRSHAHRLDDHERRISAIEQRPSAR